MRESLKYSKEEMIIVVDTFEEQGNDVILGLWKKQLSGCYCSPWSYRQVLATNHNMNKPAKSFTSNKYNTWFSEQVWMQLAEVTQPVNVKVYFMHSGLHIYIIIVCASKKT